MQTVSARADIPPIALIADMKRETTTERVDVMIGEIISVDVTDEQNHKVLRKIDRRYEIIHVSNVLSLC